MSRYLLDTHIVLWYLQGSQQLSAEVIALIRDNANDVYYSVLCPWELSIKQTKGKLHLPERFYSVLATQGFAVLEVKDAHAQVLRELPLHHHDPFDRMLVAQAKAEHLTLITRDRNLSVYPIKTLLV